METPLKTLILAIMLSALGLSAHAETELKVNGQVRYRPEAFDRDFTSGLDESTFSLLRTRVGIDATADENTRVFIQFQDSRTLGGFDHTSGKPVSSTLTDGRNVDIHQAFIEVKNFFGEGWGIKAGRFEFNLGNQRNFGAVGWDNVGRVMEGGMFWYEDESYRITAWDFKQVENNDPALGAGAQVNNTDTDILGFVANLNDQGLEFFGSYEYNAIEDPATGENLLDRFSVGGYVNRTNNQMDLIANAVFQFGNQFVDTAGTAAIFPNQDISAWMVAAEVGYTFEGAGKGRVALGADIASGDDDATDSDVKSYNNLYPTGHKFRGYMDYFLKSNREGLMDLMLRGKVNPTNGWTLGTDVHYFSLFKDGVDRNGAATKKLGVELDMTVSTTRIKGMKFQAGLSGFFASSTSALVPGNPNFTSLRLADPDPGVWGYLMWVANF